MADDELAQKRNTGPAPMTAQPNHDREKTFQAPNPPKEIVAENQRLPEKTAEANVEDGGMDEAIDAVKRKL